jgi:hypothetical protein
MPLERAESFLPELWVSCGKRRLKELPACGTGKKYQQDGEYNGNGDVFAVAIPTREVVIKALEARCIVG